MMLSKNELLAYASEFVAFLLQSEVASDIDRIIVFGSVARADFDADSDIDLFVDSHKDIKIVVEKTLRVFEMCQTHEKWLLKGLTQELSVKTGNLAKWKLHRDVISNGIILYGPLVELPKSLQYFCLIRLTFSKLSRERKVQVWRKLYGYTQKVGAKTYTTQGLVTELRGHKIEKSVVLIPSENRRQILQQLRGLGVDYKIDDVWSDTLAK